MPVTLTASSSPYLPHFVLVVAIQHKKRDKVKEFFDVYGPDLHGTSEWSQWFGKHICPFDKEWS
jgi:hypothetical protein